MKPEARIGFELCIAVSCLSLMISWVLTRWKRSASNGITNISLVICGICVIADNSCNIWTMSKIIQYRNKPGVILEPTTGLPLHLVLTALKLTFALKLFYVLAIYSVKAAFIGIFLELKRHLNKWLQHWLNFVVVLTASAFVLNFGLIVFWCVPFNTNWTMDRSRLCSSMRSMTVAVTGTASNVLTDLAIMLIPFFVLKTFPLRRREWYGIAFVILLGILCIAATLVRFVYLYKFITVGDKNGQLPSQQSIVVITSELEAWVAVWAACLPALRAAIMGRICRSVCDNSGADVENMDYGPGEFENVTQSCDSDAGRRSGLGFCDSVAPVAGDISIHIGKKGDNWGSCISSKGIRMHSPQNSMYQMEPVEPSDQNQ